MLHLEKLSNRCGTSRLTPGREQQRELSTKEAYKDCSRSRYWHVRVGYTFTLAERHITGKVVLSV